MKRKDPSKKKKTAFSSALWRTAMHRFLTTPLLDRVEYGPFFEKRHYHTDAFRLIVFNYQGGSKRMCLFEGHRLQIEAEYSPDTGCIYVTSESMLTPPFVYLQEEVVTFLVCFAKQEDDGTNDRLADNALEEIVTRMHSSCYYEGVRKEVEELWQAYQQKGDRSPALMQEMKEALLYLQKKAYSLRQQWNKPFH